MSRIICWMEWPFFVVASRELASFFYSPIAYLVMIGMTLLLLINYSSFLEGISPMRVMREPIVAGMAFGLMPVVIMMVIVPAITMRLLSEEKRSGTYEVLMCAPIGELSVVLGKFLATVLFFMFLWFPFLIYVVAFGIEVDQPFDYYPLIAFAVVLLIVAMQTIAMGLFFSSLTRNQILAFILTFSGILPQIYFFIITQPGNSSLSPFWRIIIERICYLRMWAESLSGVMELRDVLLNLSLCFFWLFLTVRVLGMRRWA